MTLEREPRNIIQETGVALVGEIVSCSELGNERNDVLHANAFFRELPDLVRFRDYAALIDSTELFAREAESINAESNHGDIKVAQRDLAMLVTIATLLTPTAREIPVAEEAVPRGAQELLRLSRILDVPARMEDSNWADPDNSRGFSHTTLDIDGKTIKAEAIIKACVGKNWEKVDEKIEHVIDLIKIPVTDPAFLQACRKIAEDYQPMIAGISLSINYLTRKPGGLEFFRNEFLPLTMPIEIGGKKLIHSGSAFVPPHLSDALLGITSLDNPHDISYRTQNLQSAPMIHQAKSEQVLEYVQKNGTLTDQILRDPGKKQSAEGVYAVLKAVSAFRGGHRTGVIQTEPTRENGESSGQRKEMVYDLRERTVNMRERVGEFLKLAA